MMLRTSTFVLATVILLASCKGNSQPAETPAAEIQDTKEMETVSEHHFTDLVFDANTDLACGMPVSAGISDTAHYKGKTYGFCSKECKEAFAKDPGTYVTQNVAK